MKTIQIILVLFFCNITVSYSKPYDVTFDYDQQINFSDLKTFDWMQVPEKAGISSFVVQRVKDAVNEQLKAKGFTLSSSKPDFLIAEHLGKEDKVQTTDWGYNYGAATRYRRGYGGVYGESTVSTYEYMEGSLILDFVNPESKKLIWRGSAKTEVQNMRTPEKSEKVINKIVKAILKKFPPSSSK